MPVTIKDIAEYAKVSTATVSMALQGNSRVAEKTRTRIQRLAADLGYMPSGLGRALQSGKSGLIGYIIPHITVSYFNEVLQGVGCEAAHRGYGLLTAITAGSEQETLQQLKIFKEKRIDGLLCSTCDPALLPHIFDMERVGCPLTFCSTKSPFEGIPYAATDDIAGGRMAAEHLLAQGAKRLAYFSKGRGKRLDGASSVAPVQHIVTKEALAEALSAPADQRPDGIIAYSDFESVAVKETADSIGLRIPEDLMIIGFDNSPFTEFKDMRLSSIEPQKAGVGRAAMRLLVERIEGRPAEPVLLAPAIVGRRSTRCE